MNRRTKSRSRYAHNRAIFDQITSALFAFFTGFFLVYDRPWWALLNAALMIFSVYTAACWRREERRLLEQEHRARFFADARHDLDDVAREHGIDPEELKEEDE